ncbi:hypothetical protein A3860_38275 [Niastella vici]|uniref:Uncharacterized protein n=1 Tax=Niastella vici TaxID=1703345 RepID=A0A1V9FLR4_9BACT|nr:hypothetical protein A3860_38275 [Niastella vici]
MTITLFVRTPAIWSGFSYCYQTTQPDRYNQFMVVNCYNAQAGGYTYRLCLFGKEQEQISK